MSEVRSNHRRAHVADSHQFEAAYMAKTNGRAPSQARRPAKAAGSSRANHETQLEGRFAIYRAADCSR
jgi:hypothetical protein